MDREFWFDRQIGYNIKTIRESMGLTQDNLAAKLQNNNCPVSQKALEKIENGRRHIYADELYWLHNVLKVDYSTLFKEVIPMPFDFENVIKK